MELTEEKKIQLNFARLRRKRELLRLARLQHVRGIAVSMIRRMRTDERCICQAQIPHVKLKLPNGELICPVALGLRMVVIDNFADELLVNRVLAEAAI